MFPLQNLAHKELSWGRWPRKKKKFSLSLAMLQTRSCHAYQATQAPLFSNPRLMLLRCAMNIKFA